MDDLDFTSRPAKNAIYDPAVAQTCFQSLGKVELISQSGAFFAEGQTSDKMYMLVEGEVTVALVDRKRDRPVRIPDRLKRLLERPA